MAGTTTSATANKSTVDLGDSAAYREKLQSLLGGRDRFEVLASSPETFANLLAGRDDVFLRRRPFENKWTPMEILGHLIDAELLFAFRTRTILCDESPMLTPIDQDRWAKVLRHNERASSELLREFAMLRSYNLHLWRGLDEKGLARSAEHPERGRESIDDMLTMLAGHDLTHIDQLTRYIAALE